MNVRHQLKRVINRGRRQWDNLPWVEHRSRSQHVKRRRAFRESRPTIDPKHRHMLADLRHQGFHVTHLNDLGIDSAPHLLNALQSVSLELEQAPPVGREMSFTDWADDALLLKQPLVFEFGVEPSIMRFIESYLGCELAYYGPYVRRDFPQQNAGRSRLWHLDLEDHRMFKMVVYVRPVGLDNGPLEVLPADASRAIVKRYGYTGGWISNARLSQAIEQAPRQAVTGDAGTVVLVDPSRVFHRGSPIAPGHERFATFYDYTTRQPRRAYYCKPSVSAQTLDLFKQNLSESQRVCLGLSSN